MVEHEENGVDRWSYYYEYLRSNKIHKARAQYPDLDSVIVSKIRSKEIAKAVDVRDHLPTICTAPKVLNKFVKETVPFEKAYNASVSAGGENVNLNQIKRFRNLICKPETESHLLDSDTRAKKAVIYELRKIGDRTKHLLIKLGT